MQTYIVFSVTANHTVTILETDHQDFEAGEMLDDAEFFSVAEHLGIQTIER